MRFLEFHWFYLVGICDGLTILISYELCVAF